MIVIGSRGFGRIRRTLMGSVSNFVVHHSPVPVALCKYEKRATEVPWMCLDHLIFLCKQILNLFIDWINMICVFTSLIYPDLKNFAIMNLMLSSFTIFHFYIFLKVTFKKITIVFNKWCLNKDINEDCFITKFNMRSNKITITVYCKKYMEFNFST